jgi:TonB-dependent SusC/RagA subfamily outer membrane receptor
VFSFRSNRPDPTTREGSAIVRRPMARLVAIAVPVLLALAATAPLSAQDRVAGEVLDASSLEPISGVQVTVQGTRIGALTDEAGRFELTGLAGQEVTLRVRYLGYRPVTRTVAVGTTDVSIQLSVEAISLDEIVVTGTAGEQRSRAIGNTVGRVSAEEVNEVARPENVQGLIGSRVSGVRIRDATGEVGTGGSTVIRGVGSLSLSTEPLIYVDGVRINNEATGTGAAFSGAFGDSGPSRINQLNPEDIESIEIIKGPAAATLYGTEASNGVIQIITKSGRSGRPDVRLQVGQGASFLPNATEVFPTVWARDGSGELIGLNIIQNDIDEGFGSPFGTGHNQQYSASVAGAAEAINYYVSGSFDRDEGIVPYNWQNQLNARTNFSLEPTPEISANLNIGYHTSTVESASAAQPITTHIIWGTPLLEETPTRGYLASTPEEFEEEVEGLEDVDRTTVSLNLEHRPSDWLRHHLTVGTDLSNVRSSLLCRRDVTNGNPCFNVVGSREVDRERVEFLSFDYGATASLELTPNLSANTSVGTQYHRKMTESDNLEGEGLALEQLETISSTAGDQRSAEESFLENRTLGLYVQEQLVWKDRVFLTGALRGDDNSAFGQEFDFVTYPKVSGSWVVSEEPFFGESFVSTLRLRAAWGQAGQQPDAFAAIRTYAPISGPGGAPGLTPENVGNPELEPEVGEELEVGFDAGLFDERLSLEFNFYDQNTKNAIVQVPALPSRGFPGEQFVNIGQVGNTGFEVAAGGEVFRGDDVGLDLNLTLSRNTNEVEDLGGVGSIIHEPTMGQRHVEGFPLGAIFLPNIVDAEFDSEGDLQNVLCEGGDPLTGGGEPVPCDEAGSAFVGQPTPVWIGSFAATVRLFDNLELYALADWESGHTRISGDVAAGHVQFRNTRCIHTRCDPFLVATDQLIAQGESFGIAGLMDAGWAKLRTVSATYRFPASIARRIGAERASVTVAGRNVATLWVAQEEKFGHRLPDPETSEAQPLNAYIQESWPHLTSVEAVLRLSF